MSVAVSVSSAVELKAASCVPLRAPNCADVIASTWLDVRVAICAVLSPGMALGAMAAICVVDRAEMVPAESEAIWVAVSAPIWVAVMTPS